MKLLKVSFAMLAIAVMSAGVAKADTLVLDFDIEWPTTSVGDQINTTFQLDAVESIKSVDIEISHTWQGDIEFVLSSPGNFEDYVMVDNNGGSVDLGNAGTGTLADVALYSFSPPDGGGSGTWGPLGGGASTPHTWGVGPHAAGVWGIRLTDTANGDGGAIGSITIEYNRFVIPEPSSALVLLGMGGLALIRRRK